MKKSTRSTPNFPDLAGSIDIPSGQRSAPLTYDVPFTGLSAPSVVVTAVTEDPMSLGCWWVVNTGEEGNWTGFVLYIHNPAGDLTQSFNYIVIDRTLPVV